MPMPSLCLSWTPTKLLLMVFFLLFYSPTTAAPTTFQFTGTLPSTSTAPLPQIEMNPGITTKLIITVKGMIDLIIFTFQEDPYQADSFNLFIKSNNQMDATQTASFPTIEYLTLSLDTSTNLLVLQGDKGFRISKFVREKEYSVQVQGYEQHGTGYGSDNGIGSAPGSNGSGSGRTTAYFILAGVIGGLFGLVLLIKGGSVLIRKIKRRLRKSSSIFSVNSRNSNKHGDLEGGGVTPVLGGEDHGREIYAPEFKCSLTLDEKGLIGDGEIESMQQQYQKKEFPSSLTSIESGMGKSTVASTTSLIPSTGSLQNIVMSKKGPQLAAITEEISYVKPVLPLGPLKVPPLRLDEIGSKRRHSHHGKKLTASKIMPANVAGRGQQVAKTMIELPPTNVPGRGQQVAKTMTELPSHQAQKENRLDTKPNKEDKHVITMKDIRNLVDRVMREKNNEDASVDVSDEPSSKDDGGDTPNYFACMVCYQERRSAVVEPCGHVFACMNCTKRVMGRSKGCCALCSGKIKGYHALKG